MTIASFFERENEYEVRISGHSNYKRGNEPDIVCAACSALSVTFLQNLKVLHADGDLRLLVISNMKDGDVSCVYAPKEDDMSKDRVMHLTTIIRDGYRMLERKYPVNVSVI